MRINEAITGKSACIQGYVILVLVSRSFNGRVTLRHKGYFETRKDAEREKSRLLALTYGAGAEYAICGPRQLAALIEENAKQRAKRRQKGALKAAKTRAKNGPNFIRCPKCQAKSKKLFSELGGLQTRKCQNGHTFEHDKWLADRAFWAAVLTGRVVPHDDISKVIPAVQVKVDLG